MNHLQKFTFAWATILMGLAGCGSQGTSDSISFEEGLTTGLYVVSSTPAHNAFFVGTSTNQISIRMSEPVIDQANAQANIQLVRKTTSQPVPITAVEIADSNITVKFDDTPGTDSTSESTYLADNTDYEVQIFPGLTAVSGTTLLQGQTFQFFYIDFSTGSGTGYGSSVPGPPSIIDITGGAGSVAMVTFSESLWYSPIIETNCDAGSDKAATVWPVAGGDTTRYYVSPPAPCAFWMTVKVMDYVDLSGEHGVPDDKTIQVFF